MVEPDYRPKGVVSHNMQLQSLTHGSHFKATTLRDTRGFGVLDPVLGVDHAWINASTFPPHPHAGFSAVSYVFADAETGLLNHDSIGTRNVIRPGGLHWTAAGRGVVHEEVPAEPGLAAHLLQIFINLPEARQLDSPFVFSLEPEDVPVSKSSGVTVRVPIGALGQLRSPLIPPTEINLIDCLFEPSAAIEIKIPASHNAFVLPVSGGVVVNGLEVSALGGVAPAIAAAPFDAFVEIAGLAEGGHAVLFHGPPLAQSVFWHGPIAMATRDGLVRAVQAFERGEFGRLVPF